MTVSCLFSGCSYVAGVGLDLDKLDENNYTNVFAREVFGNKCSVNNIGVPGWSNYRIFLDTCAELLQKKYDYAFVSWTSYPRHVFWSALELYECQRSILWDAVADIEEQKGNEFTFSADFLKKFRDSYLLTHNDHYEILDLVRYVNILISLAQKTNTKIYFINNLCHWDSDFFTRYSNKLPSELTSYTKKLLCVDNRDDIEIGNLYNKMHNDYSNAGGIHEDLWLNLYYSFKHQVTDLGNDKSHPGPKSHKNYGLFLANQFKTI